jgi:hypothetical protein
MTRTTFKVLWFSGGGILATWLAVSPPADGVPANSPAAAVRRPAAGSEPDALNAQAARLRERTALVTLRPSTRNPFRFGAPKPSPRSATPRELAVSEAAVPPAMPAVPRPPALKLSGVAQKAGKRTAIISGEGQIYLVGEGDSVAGRFTVEKIDPEAVLLRDADGSEQRLVLPQ